jgi:hypothetical protein
MYLWRHGDMTSHTLSAYGRKILTKPTYLDKCVSVTFIVNEICRDISITSLPVEVLNHAFDTINNALNAACETGRYGYRLIHYGQRDELLVHLQLTAAISTSAVPCETQKEPDNLKNGYYQGPESNRPDGKRRSPPERA